ncbi:dnaJ homolog subfamily C member 7 homolog [Ylistrum balloti]|uniref:dnaJ homolog subfamily C member 7 homolog n=1 Tax=Ylistrum balloti TaxID=509963 RepID=UPI00290586F7|nr:dnaJ homolog subfamily C member 7 homolog [Ylistrum balloti]
MYYFSGLVFFGCLALGYGFIGGTQNSLFGSSGGSGMTGMGGGGDMFSALFGMGGGTGAGMGGMGSGQSGNSMDSMMYTLSRMTLCGETPSRIRYKTRGRCSPYECNRMTTGHDVACLGHSCCCKTFQCTMLLDA